MVRMKITPFKMMSRSRKRVVAVPRQGVMGPFSLVLFCVFFLEGVLTSVLPGYSAASTEEKNTVEIRVAYENTGLPPYYLGEGDEIPARPGAAVELLKLVDEAIPEIRIRFFRAPWKRCLGELAMGNYDVVFPASFKKSRLEIGVYPMREAEPNPTLSMIDLSYYLYVLPASRQKIRWDGGRLLGNGVIGAPTGYSIVEEVRRAGGTVDDTSPTTLQNLMKLRDGRVDGVAAQDVTADPLIEKDSTLRGIVKLEPALKTRANYLIFSHRFATSHPELVNRIWTEIQTHRMSHLHRLVRMYN